MGTHQSSFHFRDEEPANTKLRIAKYGYIVLSILICILGIVLISVPEFSLSALCWICGILLVLFGCIKIVGYLSKDLYRLAFQFDLAFGILLIVLGLVVILRTDSMIHIVCVLLGIFILADSLLKIQISIDSKVFGISQWWVILSAAIITGVFGFLLLIRPSETASTIMILLGVSFLGEGILNLITVLTVVKILNKQCLSEYEEGL